jgi:hypothetical protein
MYKVFEKGNGKKGNGKKGNGKKENGVKLGFKANMTPEMCYFSNFFGGAEFTFMASRTRNIRLMNLYTWLRDVNWDSKEPIEIPRNGKDSFNTFTNGYEYFKECRERLMGKKIYVNGKRYNDHYYKTDAEEGPRVAAGLIAKLISGCWRKNMTRRLKEVNKMAYEILGELKHGEREIDRGDFSLSNTRDDNNQLVINDDKPKLKEALMMDALNIKYGNNFFKYLLLEAPDGIYEQAGGRDTAPLWTGPWTGPDAKTGEPKSGLLAKCLSKVKENIKRQQPRLPEKKKRKR